MQSSNSSGRFKERYKEPKFCNVCGDEAKSFHFGAMTCDSCKVFFRRTVQADNTNNLKCTYSGFCEIRVSTRKHCQHCRFQKCLRVGMKVTWVMSHKERREYNRQVEQRRKEKQRMAILAKQVQIPRFGFLYPTDETYVPRQENLRNFLSETEASFVRNLVLKYGNAYKMIPYQKISIENQSKPNFMMVYMFTTIVRRFIYYATMIQEFCFLPKCDQETLLRSGMLEMCILRSALCVDLKNNHWPSTESDLLTEAPSMKNEQLKKLMCSESYENFVRLIGSMQGIGLDESSCMLLLATILLSPDRPGLVEKTRISQLQVKVVTHLEKYLKWRFGPRKGSTIFPNLLTKLADVRSLSDSLIYSKLSLDYQVMSHMQSLNLSNQEGQSQTCDIITSSIEELAPRT